MPISEAWLRDVAGRASNLAERLAGDVQLIEPAGEAERTAVVERWRRWRAIAGGDHDETFARRFAWDGLDPETARRALFPATLRDNAPLPPWARSLQQVLALLDAPDQWDRRSLDPQQPLAFEAVVLPFIEDARRRLSQQAGPAWATVGLDVHIALERRLTHALSHIASRGLLHEFRTRSPSARSGFDRLLGRLLSATPATGNYDQFVAELLGGGLIAFLHAYPVIARLLATTTDLWVEARVEFLTRLAADRPALRDVFGGGVDPGMAVALGEARSDPHNGGRSVLALIFASGLRLIYKPKDVALERGYFELLSWLNARGAPLPFRVLNVLEREGYGWVECIDHKPCADADAVARYYHRAGGLAALLYVMTASDCHFDNLLACGDQPVLIDLETLLQPAPVSLNPAFADEERDANVLTTGLLPYWLLGSNGLAYDASALGGVYEQRVDDVPAWEDVNTDDMALVRGEGSLSPRQNRVLVDDIVQSPAGRRNDVVAGFRAAYALLLKQRDALLAEDGPLRAFAHQRVRFVLRPTVIYRRVLGAALEPDCLRDGIDRSIALDILSRPLLQSVEPHPFWLLRKTEQASMERLDVPHFTVAADSTRMTLPGGSSVEDCFVASACDQQRARLEAMSASNGELQAAFVSASLATAIVPGRGRRDQPLVSPVPILSPDAMMDAAVGIARDLDACAVRAPDGSSRWIGVSFTPEVERYDLAALGLDFYNGAGGITLFLGAVERVTGGAGFRDLALAGLRPLCDALRRGGDLPELRGIGGSWGAGSATYVFTRAAELLDAPDLLDTAASAAALITRERIANDRALDVMSGSAGAILSLLALHARTGDGLALDRAVLCGQHLIQNRATTDAGLRAWPTIGGRLLTGFSHGAAGIAYALLRLYAVTGDADFLCAAEDGFAYERRQFSPTAANWADLRPGHEATFMTSWCHGAPGIGLSRIGALSTIDTPVIREEIEIALTTTMNVGEQGVDQLCCGNAGRADMLIEAGTRLERPEFHDAARLILSTLMARYQAAGQLRLLHGLPAGVYNPPLFRGMAGIGYTLLRMARPGTLPSVLLWG